VEPGSVSPFLSLIVPLIVEFVTCEIADVEINNAKNKNSFLIIVFFSSTISRKLSH
jgi:hypothetical protein